MTSPIVAFFDDTKHRLEPSIHAVTHTKASPMTPSPIPDYDPTFLPRHDVDPLGMTVIGSHIWGMAHPGSDVDTFCVAAHKTRDVLRGTAPMLYRSEFRSGTDHKWPVDIHLHEAQRTVRFLGDGNVNFVVGVASPIVMHTSEAFEKLRRLLNTHPTANVFNSIKGMAEGNFKRYREESGNRASIPEARARKLLRGLEFGLRILEHGRIEFKPPTGEPNLLGVERALGDLKTAFMNTVLPFENREVYRDWLLELRLDRLES